MTSLAERATQARKYRAVETRLWALVTEYGLTESQCDQLDILVRKAREGRA